jgi:hypothetical protein
MFHRARYVAVGILLSLFGCAVQQPATVFGEDGQGFAQAWPCDIPSRKEAPYGQNWVTIELPLRMATLITE